MNGGVIEELMEDGMYKYLGIIELDGLKHEQMKGKILKTAKGKLTRRGRQEEVVKITVN